MTIKKVSYVVMLLISFVLLSYPYIGELTVCILYFLLNTINKNYDVATASELERRFINSIRTGDPRKFKRAITKIIESKNDS